jgi:hypothetical protein
MRFLKQEEFVAKRSPISDNNFNMESTYKVAFRPSKSRNEKAEPKPKPKKQHGTQSAKAESRNFPVAKVAT